MFVYLLKQFKNIIMEITSNSLQDLINKRAEKRAYSFVDNSIDEIKKSGIQNIPGFKLSNDDYSRDFREVFYLDRNNKNNPFTLLYFKKVEEFIKEETESFVKKVEELHSQADTLLNIADNFNY